MHANEVASRDRLIDALWGESPPPSASDGLDTYVYRLRKLIGHGRLPRHGGGYLLSVEGGELDADRFELLVSNAGEAAAAGDSRGAARMLTDARHCGAARPWLTCCTSRSLVIEPGTWRNSAAGALESRSRQSWTAVAGQRSSPNWSTLWPIIRFGNGWWRR